MGISLKNTNTGEVEDLPPELYWTDEFDWVSVKGNHKRSCNGSLLVMQSIARGGRPITIGAKSDMDWVPRHTVEKLRNWASVIGTQLEVTLAYNGDTTTLTAMFDTTAKCVEATPVNEYESPKPTDDFHLTLRLIEVAE